ncbi:MAG: hypothetical protein KIT60_08335 [Burkholderiaceae bacterium]|nr:hypothetical protein [Burkholderiaceae bacterium]
MSSRPRNVQQLIAEWVCLTHARNTRDHSRGYDARHLQQEIDRQRVIDEASAAAALARQYVAGDRNAPRAA